MTWEEWEKAFPVTVVTVKPSYVRGGPYPTYRQATAMQNGFEINDGVAYAVVQFENEFFVTQGD